VAIHHPVPRPEGIAADLDLETRLVPSAEDPEERRIVGRCLSRTLEVAEELHAGVVILACGAAGGHPLDARVEALLVEHTEPEARRARLAGWLGERAASARAALDRVRSVLDQALREAERRGVRIALRTPGRIRDLPSLEECLRLLHELEGAPLRAWHDTSRAHLLEAVGGTASLAWLELLGESLAGVTLADARGWERPLLPGTGDVLWGELAGKLRAGALRALEVPADAAPESVTEAWRFLRVHGLV
jgi:sugar phosphate isomerase/epimerase